MKVKLESDEVINITDIGSNRVSFKQNSSGFWYTNDLTINCISIFDGIAIGEKAIDDINRMLKVKNERKE